MARTTSLTQNEKNLLRRYLIWCYKTTKEELDKTDRYFTQAQADDFILKELKKTKGYKSSNSHKAYKGLVDQFQVYMKKKDDQCLKEKISSRGGFKTRPYGSSSRLPISV